MSRGNKKTTKHESDSESGSDLDTTETLEKFLEKSATTAVRQMTEAFVDVAMKFTAKKGLDTTKEQWSKVFQMKFDPPAPAKAPIRPSGGAFAGAGGAGRKGKAGQELSDDRIENYRQMLRDDFSDNFKPKGHCLYCPTRGAETKVYRYCGVKVDGAYPLCGEHKTRNEGKKIMEQCKSKKFNPAKYREEMSNKRKQSATRKLADSGINVSGSSRGRVVKEPQRQEKAKPPPLRLTHLDKERGLSVSIDTPMDNLLVKQELANGKKIWVVQGYLEDPDNAESVRKLTKAELKICRESKLHIAESAIDEDLEDSEAENDSDVFDSESDDDKPTAKKGAAKKAPAKKPAKNANTSDEDLFSESDDDKPAAKKPAAKKAPAKKPVAKKTAKKAESSDEDLFSESDDDKPSPKKPAAKTSKVDKKPAAKKPSPKKPAAKKAPAKVTKRKTESSDDDLFDSSSDEEKPAAKKPVGKKPAAKKPASSDEETPSSDDDNDKPAAKSSAKSSAKASTPAKSSTPIKKAAPAKDADDDAASSDDDNDKPAADVPASNADEGEANEEADDVEKIRPDDDDDFNLDD